MNKIILEDRFTNHQKTMFILYVGAPIVIVIIKLLQSIGNPTNFNIPELSELGSNTNYGIIIGLILLYLFLISIAFLKRGFIEKTSNLYIGFFFRGRLYFKKKIDISKRSALCTLKFKSSRKYAWFSAAKPDLANTFYRHEINLLNEMHTRRDPIISLMKKSNAEKAIQFLAANFPLKEEKYNPRFRRRR